MSRATRNWIIVLILIPVVLYGVAKLAIWYSVKTTFDDFRDAAAPFAAVEYESIQSPVFGAFGVTGLQVRPHAFNDRIEAGSALVRVDGLMDKYRFLTATMDDRLPTRFNFSLNALRLPLGGDIASWFDQVVARSAAARGNAGGTCTPGAAFTTADMRSMGYEELVAFITFDFSHDQRAGGLATYARVELQDMVEVIVEGRIPASQMRSAPGRLRGVPKLADASVSLRDLSWASRANSYCADELGITEAQYTRQTLTHTRQSFAEAGFQPSDALMEAFEKFATGSAELTLNLNPRQPINPAAVNINADPEYLIDQLGFEVLVDGEPVPELGTVKQVASKTDAAKDTEPVDETYKQTPVPELPQYIKSRVQIFTSGGQVHEGYLDSVDSQKIVLTRELAGGSVTFDVGRSEVNRVLVLRP